MPADTSTTTDLPETPAVAWQTLLAGDRAAVRAAAQVHLARSADPAALAAWAALAEAAGASLLALAGWRRVLELAPGHPKAAAQIDLLQRERGADRTPDPTHADPDGPGPGAPTPGAADLARFIELFSGRSGVHARMWKRGPGQVGYSPVRAALSHAVVAAHLRGELTAGSYVVQRGDLVTQLVLDLDIRKAALQEAWGDPDAVARLQQAVHTTGLALRDGLRRHGLDPLLVDSGFKGRHLWCFLPAPQPAGLVQQAGLALAATLAPVHPALVVEVFPRQAHVPAGGLGNLLKLPLGVHLRSERWCRLLDDQGQPVADPWPVLRGVRRRPLPTGLARAAGPASDRLEVDPAESPTRAEPSAPTPAAAPATPAFTAGDFQARPRVAALLDGCPVLAEVVRGALEGGHLDRDAGVVLEHTLGHLPEGVQGVNYLVERAGADAELRMGRPHRGSPTSCSRIRRRLPGVVGRVPCACRFPDDRTYPNPLRHIETLPAPAPGAAPDDSRPTEVLLDSLAALMQRQAQLEGEIRSLRGLAVGRLQTLPGGTLQASGGTWRVDDAGGLPALHFTRDDARTHEE